MKHGTITTAFILTLPITGAIVLSIQAQANQIDISGNLTPGSLTFTAVGGGALKVSSDGFQGLGEYRDPSLPNPPADPTYSKGNAQFGPINGVSGGSFLTGPNIGPTPPGVFIPIPPANQLFEYVSDAVPPADGGGALDSLTATIAWTKLAANAPLPGEPQLFGTGVVNTSSGDAKFTMDFPVGGVFDIFANFPLTGGCDLTQLALGPPSCSVTFEIAAYEGGDATPGTTTVTPEPMSSSMALGLALFCLWGTYQLTWRERRDHGASA